MNAGMSIFALSLVMNFLVLPLYNYADAMQAKAMALETKLSYGIKHIKQTFSGEEQLMMLQTYYRQNHYSPYNVVKCSLPVLLEIPFFIAAYDFLFQLDILRGMTLGPVKDLGTPDGLLVYGDYTINLLPLIMTLLNIAATFFFAKSYPIGTKIQLYGIAGFFLFFLYNSPAGLVFYWTLNNLFNLFKTIVIKTKEPMRNARLVLALSSMCLLIHVLYINKNSTAEELAFSLLYSGIAILSILYSVIRGFKVKTETYVKRYNYKVFLVSSVFLTVFFGLVIPSNIISASPQEFVILGHLSNPIEYIIYSFASAFGACFLWPNIFYYLSSLDMKNRQELLICQICMIAILNYLFFGRHLGTMNATLQYEKELYHSYYTIILNFILIAGILFFMKRFWNKMRSVAYDSMLIGVTALLGVGIFNLCSIHKSIQLNKSQSQDVLIKHKIIELSQKGSNVVVLMLDRTLGPYIPYIFNEKPELKQHFEGFVYYPNTLSFGGCTNIGSPCLFGGYEYTPVGMNTRDAVSLKDKHNEALRVMPYLFDDKGYSVTICDPTYANYQWIPDLSIYDERPDIRKYITMGRIAEVNNEELTYSKEDYIEANRRNFFVHSIFKSIPLCAQRITYDGGNYNSLLHRHNQQVLSLYASSGVKGSFIDAYSVLSSLIELTNINDRGDNYLLLTNDTTHNYCMLSLPDYIPAKNIDNYDYEKSVKRINDNNRELHFTEVDSFKGYQVNMAAFLQLEKWFAYLKEQGVYDNTRIILASDHGSIIKPFKDFETKEKLNTLRFRPLLMVKDFNKRGPIVTSHELMSNADVPRLAMQGIIENPINPFTGQNIFDNEFSKGKQYVFDSGHWSVDFNNGNQFIADDWYTVEGDINNMDNWHLVKKNSVLPY